MEQILNKLAISDIVKFETGYDCLNNLNQKPDVILLDYNMDELDGYEVLKKIKRYDPNIYTVMLSAQEDIEVAVEALKHGAFDYIKKGNNIEEKISEVLNKIIKVNELLASTKPNLIKKIFKYI